MTSSGIYETFKSTKMVKTEAGKFDKKSNICHVLLLRCSIRVETAPTVFMGGELVPAGETGGASSSGGGAQAG